MRYAEELRVVYEPFIAKFSSVETVKEIIEDARNVLERIDKEVAPMALEINAEEENQKVKNKAYWVTQGLTKKDPRATMKAAQELQEVFGPYLAKYSTLESQKETIAEVSQILERVRNS